MCVCVCRVSAYGKYMCAIWVQHICGIWGHMSMMSGGLLYHFLPYLFEIGCLTEMGAEPAAIRSQPTFLFPTALGLIADVAIGSCYRGRWDPRAHWQRKVLLTPLSHGFSLSLDLLITWPPVSL